MQDTKHRWEIYLICVEHNMLMGNILDALCMIQMQVEMHFVRLSLTGAGDRYVIVTCTVLTSMDR